jgi:membrane peptidoglycan carboxypeptidase
VLDTCNLNGQPVFDGEPIAQLVDIMQDVVTEGTGRAAQLADRPVAGKTGTADGGRDVWFVGFTPDTVTAVWGGNDENKPAPGSQVTGGAIAAGIWKNYMEAYYRLHDIPPGRFAVPVNPLLHDSELNLSPWQISADDGKSLEPTKKAASVGNVPHRSFIGKVFHKLFGFFH